MLRLATRFGGIARLQTFKRWRASSTGTVAPPATWDVTPAPSFSQGLGQTYNVANTGPISLGYTAGGTYDVDVNGQPLPAGITLSAAGMLTDGGATAGNTTGVIFGYNEPNALPVLTLHSGSTTGQLPYMATIYPAEGTVPIGMTIVSSEDSSLRASVLSRWPDNSAQVVVVAGHKTGIVANSTTTITCRAGIQSDTALTTADIASKFTTGIAFANFGGGTQTLNSWGSPDRIWWANSQVICARYRQSLNVGVMEAVIDVHAFVGGRAFVEVVIENSKMNITSPVSPASQNYTNATVSVNGAQINPGGTSSSAGINAVHQPFRAWYCSGWVGGDPGIEVTHDTASMQAHPLLFKIDQPGGSMAAYSSDVYTPWSTGRHRASGMGGGGDHESIGPLTHWDTRYLQTGDKLVRRATIASGLAILTYNVNYRSQATNLVPTFTELAGKTIQSNFPSVTGSNDTANWEVAHHPASGLMAFLCRPSPVFIEIAQKVAVWNGLWDRLGLQVFSEFYQVRGVGWCMRSLAHATFLTPSDHAWKASGATSISSNVDYLTTFYKDTPPQDLAVLYEAAPNSGYRYADYSSGWPGMEIALWFGHYCITEFHKAASAKLLSGAAQTKLNTFADFMAAQPVRYVTESLGTEWRYIPYADCVGKENGVASPVPTGTDNSPNPEPTWSAMRSWYHLQLGEATVPSGQGTFYSTPTGPYRRPRYSEIGAGPPENPGSFWNPDTTAGAFYPSYFVAALAAATERGINGSSSAWATVVAGISNWSSWRSGFGSDPRWGAYPRNM